MSKLANMFDELTAFRSRMWDLANEVYAPGTRVSWLFSNVNGDYIQDGKVLQLIGTPRDPRLRIKNLRTGRVVDLTLERVVREERLLGVERKSCQS